MSFGGVWLKHPWLKRERSKDEKKYLHASDAYAKKSEVFLSLINFLLNIVHYAHNVHCHFVFFQKYMRIYGLDSL